MSPPNTVSSGGSRISERVVPKAFLKFCDHARGFFVLNKTHQAQRVPAQQVDSLSLLMNIKSWVIDTIKSKFTLN